MPEKRLFDKSKPRYETKGISEELSIEYRIILWNFIEELASEMDLDYLQVFEFKVENGDSQIILHSQEVPEYVKEHKFPLVDEGVENKVFVIDDGDHCTMLWASEY